MQLVKVSNYGKTPEFGEFVGLLSPSDDDSSTSVVVRLEHYGLYLNVFHPSRVTFITVEEREAYNP